VKSPIELAISAEATIRKHGKFVWTHYLLTGETLLFRSISDAARYFSAYIRHFGKTLRDAKREAQGEAQGETQREALGEAQREAQCVKDYSNLIKGWICRFAT